MIGRVRSAVAAALTLSLLLAGCAAPSGYDEAAAEGLQTKVAAVTTSSAASDFAAALLALDELVAQAKDALARNQISQARYDSIIAAVSLVRADLESAMASRQPPAEEPTDGQDANQDTTNQGTGGSPGDTQGDTGGGGEGSLPSRGGDEGNPAGNDEDENDGEGSDKGKDGNGNENNGKGNGQKKDDPPTQQKPKNK